jgi:crossover junction endodeoxyribonuclease RuvC
MTRSVKILGIDPGLRNTGWGLVHYSGNSLKYLAHGIIHPSIKGDLAGRLADLFEQLKQIIERYQPDEAAVEETFVNTNAASTLKLGMARGVVLLAPAIKNLPVGEYAANKVKKAVVGVGHADKNQVSLMVQRLLPGCGAVDADAADALAVAICHAHYRSVIQLG